MTKSQNTKKDLCITSEQLTEQWDKGILPEGDYYIKKRNGLLSYDNINSRCVWRNSIDEDIVEVLAPVPSYDEWFQIKNLASLTSLLQEKNIECLHRENKLKELLKECKEVIKNVDTYYGNYDSTNGYLVITKIDEVLK